MRRGWHHDNYRHRLARYGIKTKSLTSEEIKQRHDLLVANMRPKQKHGSFIKGGKE
jgi:hypothetical protein